LENCFEFETPPKKNVLILNLFKNLNKFREKSEFG